MIILRRLHTYLALMSLCQFVIYGIAGLTAAVQTSRARPKIARAVRYVPYEMPAGAGSRRVADDVYQLLDLPFTRPMPDFYLRKTADGHLLLDFLNINGIFRVTVLEGEGKLRIEEIRNSPWLFLEDLHATRGEAGAHFALIRLWDLYNRCALWSLMAMTLTGTWLWLRSSAAPGWRGWHRAPAIWLAPLLLGYGVSAAFMIYGVHAGAWLKRLHQTAGLWRAGAGDRWWNVVVMLASLGLFELGVTGLALWCRRARGRAVGTVLLVVNLALGLGLIYRIRSAGP